MNTRTMVASALTKSLSVLQPLGVFTFHENEGNIKVLLLAGHLLQVIFFTWQGLVFTTYFCTFFICNSVITKLWSKLCQLSTVHLRFGGRIFWKTGNKFLNCVRNQSHYCKPTEYSLAKRDINKNKKQENSHNGI